MRVEVDGMGLELSTVLVRGLYFSEALGESISVVSSPLAEAVAFVVAFGG